MWAPCLGEGGSQDSSLALSIHGQRNTANHSSTEKKPATVSTGPSLEPGTGSSAPPGTLKLWDSQLRVWVPRWEAERCTEISPPRVGRGLPQSASGPARQATPVSTPSQGGVGQSTSHCKRVRGKWITFELLSLQAFKGSRKLQFPGRWQLFGRISMTALLIQPTRVTQHKTGLTARQPAGKACEETLHFLLFCRVSPCRPRLHGHRVRRLEREGRSTGDESVVSRQILWSTEIAVLEAGVVVSGVFCIMMLFDRDRRSPGCVSQDWDCLHVTENWRQPWPPDDRKFSLHAEPVWRRRFRTCWATPCSAGTQALLTCSSTKPGPGSCFVI